MYCWPAETEFAELELEVEERQCPCCGRRRKICDHRQRRLFTFDGPLQLVCKLVHCPDPACPGHRHTASPEAETALAMPRWVIDWDIFCWLGHRRFARHWSVPQLVADLADTYQIRLSPDALERYLGRYQCMVAARQQDAQQLAQAYRGAKELVLAIDGLQPEKGHETLYVVREVSQRRVWFAEPLLSSSAAEVQRLLGKARQWAERLCLPVRLWLSDKQDAFVTGVAAEFPGVPHRYCSNHFLRDLAKPALEADSRAKVQMRSKVRGLRAIEREVLEQQAAAAAAPTPDVTPPAVEAAPPADTGAAAPPADTAAATDTAAAADTATAAAAASTGGREQVVLDYCAAVRGILNDDQGGPLEPPGLRMAAALGEVQASLQNLVGAKKGGAPRRC